VQYHPLGAMQGTWASCRNFSSRVEYQLRSTTIK
jgi:hypothetical protein